MGALRPGGVILTEFEEYYPGSRERRSSTPAPATGVEEDLLGEPRYSFVLRGHDTEFFTLGQLARAIGRSSVTLRTWEANGILPTSGYRKPSDDIRGRVRLYTRAQAEGIIRICQELGIMGNRSRAPMHEFTRRATALFTELRRAQ